MEGMDTADDDKIYDIRQTVEMCIRDRYGGRYRTRTCDLLHVKQMLYQLS